LYYICTMFRNFGLISIAILTLFAMASCQGEKLLLLTTQEEQIDSYISKEFPENEVLRLDGANRVIITPGSGKEAATGDSIRFIYEAYVFKGSPVGMFWSDSANVVLGSRYLVEGLNRGIEGMRLGEQSLIFFSAKYGFYDQNTGIVPSMSALMYNVLVTGIKKNN
jgi:FKBP-type peptidyl-prolyl cis-trans isomerase